MAPQVLILLGILVAGLVLEHFFPLRKSTQPKTLRVLINIGIAAVGAASLRLLFFPLVLSLSGIVVSKNWGLLALIELPRLWETGLALLLLDYTLYHWHVMNHKIPFLWRFHNVHHVDLDLDVSTASRFHFGELMLSALFRSGQILLLGIDPVTLLLFETMVTASAQFHHSNIRLPFRLEKLLSKICVTPRMHGIHHSIVLQETNSNFSTMTNAWDRLHRTLRLNVPQTAITIGVPFYRDPKELGLLPSLLLPFTRQRPWDEPAKEREFRDPLSDLKP